jgi:hypothetical protein
MLVHLGCVVEGEGEVQAVPILVRRIAERLDPGLAVQIPRPVLSKRSQLAEALGELESRIQMAVAKLHGRGGVLVLLDSEDDDPAKLGPSLLERARRARADIPIAVVLAVREYEGWFLAAAESLGGKCGLPADLKAPSDPESYRGAKEWLRKRMPRERKYSEPGDQPVLTATFDLDLARQRSPSFDTCFREVTRLLTQLMRAAESAPEGTAADAEQSS